MVKHSANVNEVDGVYWAAGLGVLNNISGSVAANDQMAQQHWARVVSAAAGQTEKNLPAADNHQQVVEAAVVVEIVEIWAEDTVAAHLMKLASLG